MLSDSSSVPEVAKPAGRAIRACVVSDIRLHREGLTAALEKAADIEVVGVFRSIEAVGGALAALSPAPDVVVVDSQFTNDQTALVCVVPGSRLVAVGVGESEPEIIACAESGMSGYVRCEASIDEFLQVVRSVQRDELLCSPRIAAKLFRRLRAPVEGPLADPVARLTSRECQVLALIRDGLANKEIADELRISESTVKSHVHHLLEKLRVTRRLQAARMDAPAPVRQVGRQAWRLSARRTG